MRNQVIKTAQGSSRIETSGYFGEQAKTYYEMLASGGIGLLIVESCNVEYPLGFIIRQYNSTLTMINISRLNGYDKLPCANKLA